MKYRIIEDVNSIGDRVYYGQAKGGFFWRTVTCTWETFRKIQDILESREKDRKSRIIAKKIIHNVEIK